MLQVRFFNDWGPDNSERLLIGFAPVETDIGQRREAVRVATQADQDRYPGPYQAYRATFEATTMPAYAEQGDGEGRVEG